MFCGHELDNYWAYKYDSELKQGINVHADKGTINLNLWITDGAANLNPQTGGLVVYHYKPPRTAVLRNFNTGYGGSKEEMDKLLQSINYRNTTVPYQVCSST